MKLLYKIAPLLLVFVLGIFPYPRAEAGEKPVGSAQWQNDPQQKKKFVGFVIDPNPAERLLYGIQPEIVENEVNILYASKKVESNKQDIPINTEVIKECPNHNSNCKLHKMNQVDCKNKPNIH